MRYAAGSAAPLPKVSASGVVPTIAAMGAAAATTRKTMRVVESTRAGPRVFNSSTIDLSSAMAASLTRARRKVNCPPGSRAWGAQVVGGSGCVGLVAADQHAWVG